VPTWVSPEAQAQLLANLAHPVSTLDLLPTLRQFMGWKLYPQVSHIVGDYTWMETVYPGANGIRRSVYMESE
ncbi:hypothetical protein SARC_15759, partial [Sphaeroforma arctica JP610]